MQTVASQDFKTAPDTSERAEFTGAIQINDKSVSKGRDNLLQIRPAVTGLVNLGSIANTYVLS